VRTQREGEREPFLLCRLSTYEEEEKTMSANLSDPDLIDHSRAALEISASSSSVNAISGQDATWSDDGSTAVSSPSSTSPEARPSLKKFMCVGLLVFINLINYMDRFTISAVLPEIKEFYDIDDTKSGMLNTSFILSFMVLAPIFGYLGDRYNRLVIMSGGILFWAGTTLAGSFVPGDNFGLFITLRALVGVGEASYSTIAPTIIADLFTNQWRTAMLTVFYFAIPAGAGLGFVSAGYVDQATGHWQDVLRITPPLGLASVILLWIVLRKDPPRGEAEGATGLHNQGWLSDLYHIARNKSFIFSCLGYTCQCFIVGAVSFWVPTYMSRAYLLRGETPPNTGIAKIFGAVTAFSGIIGVVAGTFIAAKWKTKKGSSQPDCWVSAIGLIASSPLLYLALIYAQYQPTSTWVLVFLSEVFLCLDWAIVTDILLYVTVPTRRSTAEAFQILTSHALGDAGSSFFVGKLSDAIRGGMPDDTQSDFIALQRSLFVNPFVGLIGGLLFLVCAWYIDKDKSVVDAVIAGAVEDTPPNILAVEPDDGMDRHLIDPSTHGNETPQLPRAGEQTQVVS